MEDVFIKNALTYAAQYRIKLAERLGHGVHGIIFSAGDKSERGRTAVKVHRELQPYIREQAAYERLRRARVTKISGFNVPQLINADDELLIIEMSVVTRPYVLDFAGAYLDRLPDFTDDIWAEWEAAKREQFEVRWPEVRAVLDTLEGVGIYMVDVSPANIAFRV